MATRKTPAGNDLLKHFDSEVRARLQHLLGAGSITQEHVAELIRLTAGAPDYRSLDAIDSLLEDAEEMDVSAFRAWVDKLLADSKDR